MKKQIFRLMLVMSFLVLGAFAAKAQEVVVRPRHDGVEVRGVRPGPRHIWRDCVLRTAYCVLRTRDRIVGA